MRTDQNDDDAGLRNAFELQRTADRANAPTFRACAGSPAKERPGASWNPMQGFSMIAAAAVVAAIVWIAIPGRKTTAQTLQTAELAEPTEFLLETDFGWTGLAEVELSSWKAPTDFLLVFSEGEPSTEVDS